MGPPPRAPAGGSKHEAEAARDGAVAALNRNGVCGLRMPAGSMTGLCEYAAVRCGAPAAPLRAAARIGAPLRRIGPPPPT